MLSQLFQMIRFLNCRVPAKVKTKILNNEFIDFGTLLINPIAESKYLTEVGTNTHLYVWSHSLSLGAYIQGNNSFGELVPLSGSLFHRQQL